MNGRRDEKLDFGPAIATFPDGSFRIPLPSSPPRMAPSFQDIVEEARLSARALWDYGDNLFNPTVRLGVTGLSRAGKTVFITALIHGLTRGGRFPVFEPYATGGSPAPGWSRSPTMRCRASPTKATSAP